MTFSLTTLFVAGCGYLFLLFIVAHAAERGWLPQRLLLHPVTYSLSLGVFASAFAIYGIVGLAYEYGHGFLAYYVGVAGTFLFAPLVLMPLRRICRVYQLSSLADLLTFRFRSQWAGSAVTVAALLSVLPLLALQIQAVSDSVTILTEDAAQLLAHNRRPDSLALIFCFVITLFAILFGSRHRTGHSRHNGLVASIAFDSLVKTAVLLILGLVALFGVFDGPLELERWLATNPDVLALLASPVRQDSARALMLIFFAAAVCAPHLFHMIYAENPGPGALRHASWGYPLLLLLLSLPVLPILWAGFRIDTLLPPEYFSLAVAQANSPVLALAVFIAGLSAASAAMIVVTLALASMCLNHLILPFYQPDNRQDIYRWLVWTRRLLIGAILLAGYVFYRILSGREDLANLSMTAFTGTLQFLPGVLAVLYWPRANRIGLLAGLGSGLAVWLVILLLPLIGEWQPETLLSRFWAIDNIDLWSLTALVSLGLNTAVFALVSLLTPISDEERAAAEVCAPDDLNRPTRRALLIHSPEEIKQRLASALGKDNAAREVERALTDLMMKTDERRPFALRRLRNRIEINLSGLMGPSVAHDIVNRLLPYAQPGSDDNEDINLIETRLERYKYHLTGLAADLDSLRRYHRRTLEELPIGLCSLGRDREILMWNQAMAALTGIAGPDVIGSHLSSLPPPWRGLLEEFFNENRSRRHKQRINIEGRPRWLSLHKASNAPDHRYDGQVIVVEDITETQILEQKLVHNERLASIGRLAAGVAHEIGNPVTGIACLTQNLRYDTDNPDSLLTADEILKQTERITRIVQTLVNFAHAGADAARRTPEVVAVNNCAEEAMRLLALNKEAKPVDFRNLCDPALTVMADPQRLQQVFVNLLSNARDASPENSVIEVAGGATAYGVHITVTDTGSGIDKAQLAQVFDPFFTTKVPGQGTGLGLALVYSIIEDLDGEIELESPVPETGRGTRVHLWLPPATTGQVQADTVF